MNILREVILAAFIVASSQAVSEAEDIQTMEVSAYTISDDECGSGDGITASGEPAVPYYTCAADHLPFGTIVVVDGQEWVVMDRFGGGYTDRLDLCMPTKEECFEFGRKTKEVQIFYE